MSELPESIRKDHSSVDLAAAKHRLRAELAEQVAEYLARGGRIEHVPTGVGEYQTLTISEREKRKRERLRGRVLDAKSSSDG